MDFPGLISGWYLLSLVSLTPSDFFRPAGSGAESQSVEWRSRSPGGTEGKGKIWRFPKSGGYPQTIHFCRIFPYKPSSYWGTPILGNLHIAINSDWGKAIEVVGLAWSVCQCVFSCELELKIK